MPKDGTWPLLLFYFFDWWNYLTWNLRRRIWSNDWYYPWSCIVLCSVGSFISWFFMANDSKEVVFHSRFNIFKALIQDESINWKVDSCIYSPCLVVDVLMMLKHNDQYVQVGVNTCGHFCCVWIIIICAKLVIQLFHPNVTMNQLIQRYWWPVLRKNQYNFRKVWVCSRDYLAAIAAISINCLSRPKPWPKMLQVIMHERLVFCSDCIIILKLSEEWFF